MQAGKMDRRIQLQSFSVTQDTDGSELKTWTTYATVWSAIRHITKLEEFERESDRRMGYQDIEFQIYYRNDIKETDRIIFEDKYYDVYSVIEMGRRRTTKIRAEWSDANRGTEV